MGVIVIVGVITVGYAEENDIRYKEYKNLTFNYQQKVAGTGFFSAYKHSFMPDALGPEGASFNGVEAKSKAHGSGSVNTDLNMYAESYHLFENYTDVRYDEEGEPYEETEDANSIINLKEDGQMTYSPISMAVGSRYYNIHPVTFNSLLKDTAFIKNRDNLNSINYMTEEAHKLNRLLDIQSDYSKITMNIDENLTNGKVHFGALQLVGTPVDEVPEEETSEEEIHPLGAAMKAWKKPLTEVDEDYIGDFNISKRMNLTAYSKDDVKEEDEWLPCCSYYGGNGGWYDMTATNKKSFGSSTRGIFDCKCFKVPDKAQFLG